MLPSPKAFYSSIVPWQKGLNSPEPRISYNWRVQTDIAAKNPLSVYPPPSACGCRRLGFREGTVKVTWPIATSVKLLDSENPTKSTALVLNKLHQCRQTEFFFTKSSINKQIRLIVHYSAFQLPHVCRQKQKHQTLVPCDSSYMQV